YDLKLPPWTFHVYICTLLPSVRQRTLAIHMHSAV
ncbi:UNVERIFIED_CONTAM: hypothetical protein H355_000429, partial [Colinus virginianus]